MLALIKKYWIGAIVTVVTLVLTIVSLAMFSANVTGEGYFKGMDNSTVVAMAVLAIVFEVITLVLPLVPAKNKWVETGVRVVSDVLRVLIPIFLVVALLGFVGDRIEGLAYIYFSNEDVIQEVQTPANLASAELAINGMIMFGVTWVVSLIGSFFGITRSVKEEPKAEVAAE